VREAALPPAVPINDPEPDPNERCVEAASARPHIKDHARAAAVRREEKTKLGRRK